MTSTSTINKEAGLKLQQFINSKGKTTPLVLDGYCGRLTTAAIYHTFANKNAVAITDGALNAIADILSEPNTVRIKAVAAVETSGSGWESNGNPKILYERHYFYRLTNGRVGTTWFSAKGNGDYTRDKNKNNINDSWEKLAAASYYDARAAFSSISMSLFQIMGSHYSKLGYDEPWEMLWDITNDEAKHYELMAKWIILNGKLSEFKKMGTTAKSCESFAAFWNGRTYYVRGYHSKLASAIKKYSTLN